jgi:molybdenum cofactor biosynthesis enzyme MoaA
MIKIIQSYVRCGGKLVQFTGGEPLLNEDIYGLIRETKLAGGVPEINSNGVALNGMVAQKLVEAGLEVLKVSLPATEGKSYKKITGVDAFENVISNIKSALPFIYIRVNHVVTKDSVSGLKYFFDRLNGIRIPEILLLELLYYKDVPTKETSKAFFEREYVDIKKELGGFLEEYQGKVTEDYPIFGVYGTKFYKIKSANGGADIVFKQADRTLRIDRCRNCNNYCQEGVYEMRVSDGGYLNVCNVVNELGFNAINELNSDSLDKAFLSYKELFEKNYYADFEEFKKKNSLTLKK